MPGGAFTRMQLTPYRSESPPRRRPYRHDSPPYYPYRNKSPQGRFRRGVKKPKKPIIKKTVTKPSKKSVQWRKLV